MLIKSLTDSLAINIHVVRSNNMAFYGLKQLKNMFSVEYGIGLKKVIESSPKCCHITKIQKL